MKAEKKTEKAVQKTTNEQKLQELQMQLKQTEQQYFRIQGAIEAIQMIISEDKK